MKAPKVPEDVLWNEIVDGVVYPSNEKWYSHLIDQYKLYVEMADRISQRRTTANSYFLTVNSAILAFVGYLNSKNSDEYLWLLAFAGMTLCVLWRQGIASYRDINTAKWKVVHEIEKRLPISPYDAEWEFVGRGNDSKLYRPISHVEGGVPWVFMFLHFIVFTKTMPFAQYWDMAKGWFN